jgi:SNF2 family DNA or RNA helicase
MPAVAISFGSPGHVIHFTRTWNPAREDQATDRAYRIGQTKDVYAYYPVVVAKDFVTFDAKLDELLETKRKLSQDMLNGCGDVGPSNFADLEDVAGGTVFDSKSANERRAMSV